MLPLPQAAWQRDWCWERRGCDSSSACLRYRAHCTGCSSWSAGYSSLQKQCQNKIMDYIKQMHWYQMSWSIYVEIDSPSSTCTLFTIWHKTCASVCLTLILDHKVSCNQWGHCSFGCLEISSPVGLVIVYHLNLQGKKQHSISDCSNFDC